MAGLTLAMLQERNVTLANGNAYTLDTPLVDVVEGFKMWDDEITQSITTRDFLSTPSHSSIHLALLPQYCYANIYQRAPANLQCTYPASLLTSSP